MIMSVQPARHNFKVWKGATFRYKFTYLQGGEGSQPMDLTGYTGRLVIKDPRTTTVYQTLTTENGGIIIDAMNGTIELLMSAGTTQGFDWKTGNYQLTLTKGDDTEPLLYGAVATTGF